MGWASANKKNDTTEYIMTVIYSFFSYFYRNFQHTSKRTGETGEVVSRIECCPAETHFIQLRGGISREGQIVELYRNYRTVQKFYETSCRPDVKDRPCRFLDKSIQNLSRCVQKYSYVYAFVKDYNVSGSYRLDYIRMKTGCSCEVEFRYPASLDVVAEDD